MQPDTWLYLRLLVRKSQGQPGLVWLDINAHESGDPKWDERYKEWHYLVRGITQGDWQYVSIDLQDAFRRTYQKQGMVLLGLAGYRLRGSLEIASIQWE